MAELTLPAPKSRVPPSPGPLPQVGGWDVGNLCHVRIHTDIRIEGFQKSKGPREFFRRRKAALCCPQIGPHAAGAGGHLNLEGQ